MEPTTTPDQQFTAAAEQGIRHFRAQGASWHTAGERAAESLINHLGVPTASTDAFSLRAAFAATARNLRDREDGPHL